MAVQSAKNHAASGASFFPSSTPTARELALASTVVELEEYAAQLGWDAPVRVYALVSTAAMLADDPSLTRVLDEVAVAQAEKNPEHLTAVEQENLPQATDLEDLLAQLAWPQSVAGVALSVERSVLPPQAEAAAAAISDPTERMEFLSNRKDREDVRMVVGVLRSGESWCALRARSRDDNTKVAQGSDLVPGLVQALATTLV